jgi:hypothetical protein
LRTTPDESIVLLVKPKDALQQAGFPVKMGQGRLSREAIEKCKELAAQGVKIDGYEVTTQKESTAPVVVKNTAPTGVKVIESFTLSYPAERWIAKGKDGRIWSMKECCNTCKVSLVQCHCGKPSILGDIPLDIIPKT